MAVFSKSKSAPVLQHSTCGHLVCLEELKRSKECEENAMLADVRCVSGDVFMISDSRSAMFHC